MISFYNLTNITFSDLKTKLLLSSSEDEVELLDCGNTHGRRNPTLKVTGIYDTRTKKI